MADELPPSSSEKTAEALMRDRIATHTVTNYLLAAYQGRFAFFNILAQLQFPQLNTETISETRQVLDQVAFWQEDLWRGQNLFQGSWTFPESIDAQRALDYLIKVKPELYGLANQIISIARAGALPSTLPEIAVLAASFGRSAYSKEHTIKGFVEFGTKFPGAADVTRHQPLLQPALEEVKLTHAVLDAIKKQSPNFEPNFVKGLLDRTLSLVGVFRTQAHEINQIVSTFQGGLTFENADFTVDEALGWRELNIPVATAGYWRAYGFPAQDADPWLKNPSVSPPAAAAWLSFGFHSETALPWIKSGFPPALAKIWYDAGYDEREARDYIEQGIQDPAKVPAEEPGGA